MAGLMGGTKQEKRKGCQSPGAASGKKRRKVRRGHYVASVWSVEVPAKSRLMHPCDENVRRVGAADFPGERRHNGGSFSLWLDVADLPWLIQTIGDDVRAVANRDLDEAAVAVGDETAVAAGDEAAVAAGDEAAVAATDSQTDSQPVEVAQESGLCLKGNWGRNGFFTATITYYCPYAGKVIEMDGRRLSKETWEELQRVKGHAYTWAQITAEQRWEAAGDYVELQVAKLPAWGGNDRSCWELR